MKKCTAMRPEAASERRSATPNAQFHLSEPTARFAGIPEEIVAQSGQQQALLWKLYGRLAWRIGRPTEDTAWDLRRGGHVDLREALEYDLIDQITAAG